MPGKCTGRRRDPFSVLIYSHMEVWEAQVAQVGESHTSAAPFPRRMHLEQHYLINTYNTDFFVCIMGYLTHEQCINWVLAHNWLQGRSSPLCTSFSIPSAERNCLLLPWPCWLCWDWWDTVTPMDCKEQFETSWGGWQEPLLNGLKKRGGRRRAKGLTWYHLCTTRNRAWALLMPRTAVRLVVPWLLHCSWTLWWWEGLQEGNTGSIHTLPGGTKQWNYVRASCLMETVWATVDHSSCLLRPLFPPAPLQNTALWTFPDIQH